MQNGIRSRTDPAGLACSVPCGRRDERTSTGAPGQTEGLPKRSDRHHLSRRARRRRCDHRCHDLRVFGRTDVSRTSRLQSTRDRGHGGLRLHGVFWKHRRIRCGCGRSHRLQRRWRLRVGRFGQRGYRVQLRLDGFGQLGSRWLDGIRQLWSRWSDGRNDDRRRLRSHRRLRRRIRRIRWQAGGRLRICCRNQCRIQHRCRHRIDAYVNWIGPLSPDGVPCRPTIVRRRMRRRG